RKRLTNERALHHGRQPDSRHHRRIAHTRRRGLKAMECVRVAVVGLGYWGPNLARVVLDQEDVELAWLCDLDEERLSKLGRRYPMAKQTVRFEDLLEDPELDAIFIATPVFTHADLAEQ